MRSERKVSALPRRLIAFAAGLAAAATIHGATAAVAGAPESTVRRTAAQASPIALPNAVTALDAEAPASAHFERVWHFGRVTGDLERIIAFYHDLLGLSLRGPRDVRLAFNTSPALEEFVAAPDGAQFRAVHFPIPGASHSAEIGESISLEAFEYRGIDRRQELPALSRSGVSSLRFLVPDLERVIAAAKAADVAFITLGESLVTVCAPPGIRGKAKAVMLRDPDGYPVELMQLVPAPVSGAPSGSRILGAMMVVVVADLDASLRFYHRFFGEGAGAAEVGPWRQGDGIEQLRGLVQLEHRSAVLALPGSTLKLELLNFRGASLPAYRPVFQDIGHGHLALYTHDIPAVLAAVHAAGGHTLSRTGTWTQFTSALRGFYTRDPDGFFLEVIERD